MERCSETAHFIGPTDWLGPTDWPDQGIDFPKKKAPHLRAGLVGGWLMGFEPTTPGTTIQCSNQLSYSHRVPSVGPRLVQKGAQRYSTPFNVNAS